MNILKKIFRKPESELKCFDEIGNVFHGNDVNYELVFFPLCSININSVIPNRNEWIHFVDVWNNGDIEDLLFHQYRTRDLIRFKLENSKYHYYGNTTAFPKQTNLEDWNKESKAEFDRNKEGYLKFSDRQDFQKSDRKLKEMEREKIDFDYYLYVCLLYTSPSPRDKRQSRMPSSA